MVVAGVVVGGALWLTGKVINTAGAETVALAVTTPNIGRNALASGVYEFAQDAANGMPAKDIVKKVAYKATLTGALSGILYGCVRTMVVGTKRNASSDNITYDCWKKVVRNTSEEPSDGILLKDLLDHPFVAGYEISDEDTSDLPHIVIENIWKERFEIQYLYLIDSRQIVCHANPLTLM